MLKDGEVKLNSLLFKKFLKSLSKRLFLVTSALKSPIINTQYLFKEEKRKRSSIICNNH
jgi:hypothetical protein